MLGQIPTSAFLVFSILFILNGCNEPFSPKGPFEQRLVTYSVLNAQSDTQYVRLYLNYNPPGFDANAATKEQLDTTALVTISSGNQNFVFHDTILTSSLHAFTNISFKPQPGHTYSLTIASQYGNVTATTTIPGHGFLSFPNQSPLLFPGASGANTIDVECVPGPNTKGFLIRFILFFGLSSDTTFVGSIEIPISYGQDASGQATPVFSQLQRLVDPRTTISFPVANYVQTLAQLTAQYGAKIVPKQAKFYLIEVDESAYDYYNVVNGFQDKFSIRADQPDYSNIRNGLGVFGSFSVDTLVYHY
jgi:hypothetical protein